MICTTDDYLSALLLIFCGILSILKRNVAPRTCVVLQHNSVWRVTLMIFALLSFFIGFEKRGRCVILNILSR